MLIRSVLTLLCLGLFFQVEAQKVISTNGGYAETDRLSISWTMGEPMQAYLQSSNGIYTVGYQQPNLTVTQIEPEVVIGEDKWANVFPNPVIDELSIRLNETLAANEEVIIQLFTVDGKPIKALKSQGQTDLKMDLSSFPSGTYLLRLDTKNRNQVYSIIKLEP